jgi:hypothetical protein
MHAHRSPVLCQFRRVCARGPQSEGTFLLSGGQEELEERELEIQDNPTMGILTFNSTFIYRPGGW